MTAEGNGRREEEKGRGGITMGFSLPKVNILVTSLGGDIVKRVFHSVCKINIKIPFETILLK